MVHPVLTGRLLTTHEAAFGFHVFFEPGPETELQLPMFRQLSCTRSGFLDFARPIVRLTDDVELGGDR
jgi:hypothetical protein